MSNRCPKVVGAAPEVLQPQQKFYHSEEVLNSENFFLVGRGGHGNFHRGNKAVRSLVAEHAIDYVETARKDRAQISTSLFDRHPLFQNCLFVTPRDYVLPRLEKDEEASDKDAAATRGNNHNINKQQGITLPNGEKIPPTTQKRWLSRTRTQSIIEQHGSISVIRAYPRGVYIEVGRAWAIDIIDHLCREQAHEIRKNRSENKGNGKQNGLGALAVQIAPEANNNQSTLVAEQQQVVPTKHEDIVAAGEAAAIAALEGVLDPQQVGVQHQQQQQPTDDSDRSHMFASPDMMEAVEGLSALMKSEGSTDTEFATGNGKQLLESPGVGAQNGRVALVEPKNNEEEIVLITGGEIQSRFPGDMHFVCGCVGFSVLNNTNFLKLIEAYYREQIESNPGFRRDWEDKLQRLKVRRHVPAILTRAREYARSQGKTKFRLWTAQRDESNGGRLFRLSEEVWAQSPLVEITDNTALLKQRLESPLRSILMTLKRYPDLVVKEGSGVHTLVERHSEVLAPNAEGLNSTAGALSPQTGGAESVEKKRSISAIIDGAFSTPQEDWRTKLPNASYDAGDLGEPPTGWLFGRQILLNKLSCSSKVSVVVSNPHREGVSSMENHLVWEAASAWRKELPTKRFVCWMDASSESSLCSDLTRFTNSIRQDPAPDKRVKPSLLEAARLFYQTLVESRSGAEFFLVFNAAPDASTFAAWVHPHVWYNSEGRLNPDLISSIVIVPQQQSTYGWNSGLFKQLELQTVHRIPDRKWKDEKPWWCELPLPNLPPMFSAEIDGAVLDKVGQLLEIDGSMMALLSDQGSDPDLPSVLANQFARKWTMSSPSNRFSFWLSAKSEAALRQSYIQAISCLTRQDSLSEEMTEDISSFHLAKELMGLLMHMRKLEPGFSWIMVFADVPKESSVDQWFFPPESEWWNSRGRFAFTSSEREVLEVRVGDDNPRKVPAVTV